MELRRGAFFDRDGVINASPAHGRYVRTREEFHLLPEAVEWIRLCNALDLVVIVVTNQRGVSRALIDPAELERIHHHMRQLVDSYGGHIDDVFCCPHEMNTCRCRKPQPGLVLEAAAKWNIDVGRSILIGDTARDRHLAQRCGMHYVAVREGRWVAEELAARRIPRREEALAL